MAPFPITGRFVGDFVPHLVAVDTDDTIDQVAKKVAVHSVGHRVAKPKGRVQYDVLLHEELLPAGATFGDIVAEHAVMPLQWFDVRFREQEPVDA